MSRKNFNKWHFLKNVQSLLIDKILVKNGMYVYDRYTAKTREGMS
jgi:hypothetical protein